MRAVRLLAPAGRSRQADLPDCAQYFYFGVEKGTDCFCADELSPLSLRANKGECRAKCGGNLSQHCGGNGTLDVFRTSNRTEPTLQHIGRSWSVYVGCYSEAAAEGDSTVRTLDALSNAGMQMDLARCARICKQYLYWGVEHGNECYCDNHIHTDAARVLNEQCSTPCSGEADELCGGNNRIAVYRRENRDIKEPGW